MRYRHPTGSILRCLCRVGLLALTALPCPGQATETSAVGDGAAGERGSPIHAEGHYEIAWQKTLGGAKPDAFDTVARAANGDVIVAGVYHTVGKGREGWLLRLRPDGQIAWDEKIAAPTPIGQMKPRSPSDRIRHIVSADGYRFFGVGSVLEIRSEPVRFLDWDAWFVRLEDRPDGESPTRAFFQWSHSGPYRWTGREAMTYSLWTAAAADGQGFVASGSTAFLKKGSGTFLDRDTYPWVVRYGDDGEERWQRTFKGDSQAVSALRGVVLLAGGDTILAGTTGNPGKGILIRLDGEGEEVWRRTLTEPAPLGILEARPLADGNVALVGNTGLPAVDDEAAPRRAGWIGVVNPSGDLLGSHIVSGELPVRLTGLTALPGGGLAAVGHHVGADGNATDGLLVTLDESFTETGRTVFGGDTIDRPQGIAATDGLLIVVGERWVEGLPDAWAVALRQSAALQQGNAAPEAGGDDR